MQRNPGGFEGLQVGGLVGCDTSGAPAADAVMAAGKSDQAAIEFDHTGASNVASEAEVIISTATSFVADGAKGYLDALSSAVGECLSGRPSVPRLVRGTTFGDQTLRLSTDSAGGLVYVVLVRVQDDITSVALVSVSPDHTLIDGLAATAARRLQLAGH